MLMLPTSMLPARLRYAAVGGLAFVLVLFVFYQAESASASRYNDWYALWWLSNYGAPPQAPPVPGKHNAATAAADAAALSRAAELAAGPQNINDLADTDLIQKNPYGDSVEEAVRAAMEHEILNHRTRPVGGDIVPADRPADLPPPFEWPVEVGTLNAGLSPVDITGSAAGGGFAVGPEGLELESTFDPSSPDLQPALSPADISASDPFLGSAVGPGGLDNDIAMSGITPGAAAAAGFAGAAGGHGTTAGSAPTLPGETAHKLDVGTPAHSLPALHVGTAAEAAIDNAVPVADPNAPTTPPPFEHDPAPANANAAGGEPSFSLEAFGPGLDMPVPEPPPGPPAPPGLHDVLPPPVPAGISV